MTTHGIQSAITLYDAGTYTLEQAARHAGQTPETMAETLRSYGVAAEAAAAEPATTPAPEPTTGTDRARSGD